MSSTLFALLTYKVGSAVGKALIKVLLDDPKYKFLGELAPDLLDLLKDRAEASVADREQSRQVAQVAAQIAARMRPLFDAEAGTLPHDELAATLRELVLTLDAAQINSEVLVRCNLDPAQIVAHLRTAHPDATRDISAAGTALYERMLNEAAEALVATEMSGFVARRDAKDLQQGEQLLNYVSMLLQRPDAEALAFEQDYCNTVQRTWDRLELFGVRRMDTVTRQQRLSTAYVRLKVEEQRRSSSKGNDQPVPLEDETTLLNELLSGKNRLRRETNTPHIEQIDYLLARSRRIVIRGEAGSGKTTVIRWMAIRAARHDFQPPLTALNQSTVPFYIRLRERVEEGFPAPEEFARLTAPTVAGMMPQGWVHRLLENGRALVLIDGVDELPPERRDRMLDQLAELVDEYKLARFVITSRPEALAEWPEWTTWIEQEHFTESTLQRMDEQAVDNFIDHWHLAYAATVDDADERNELSTLPNSLKVLLRERNALRELASNPLLCAMICALHHENRQKLPNNRIQLYRECIEMLLEKRDDRRGIVKGATDPRLSLEQNRTLLQEFAYWLIGNGYTDCETSQADKIFERYLSFVDAPIGTRGNQVRTFFVNRAQLLREPVAGRIEFTHKTFLEFLAAQAAVEAANFGVLLDHAKDDQWREVIILAAGLARLSEREKLLKDLVDRGNIYPEHKNLYERLAFACLETTTSLNPDVRVYLVQHADTLFPPENEEDIRLVTLAGEAAIHRLVPQSDNTEAQAAGCVNALASIGGEAALQPLEVYASDHRNGVFVALSYGLEHFDHRVYAQRILSKMPRFACTIIPEQVFEHLPGLRELYLGGVVDASDSGLAFMSELDSSEQPILDINSLSYLKDLTKLWLFDIKIKDFAPLSHLTNLLELAIIYTNLKDISPLAQLSNVVNLVINQTSIQDISSLANLGNLHTLSLTNTKIQDISSVTHLVNVTTLRLNNTPINDLAPIAHLTKLRSLSIPSTPISNIMPLANLLSLQSLNLSNTAISDLAPLAHLVNLQHLSLQNTKVRDLTPLAGLKQDIRVIVDDKAQFHNKRLPTNINLMTLKEYRDEQAKHLATSSTPIFI